MTQTIARIKKIGKEFEIIVNMEKALNFKKSSSDNDFLEIDKIFLDSKKGFTAPKEDLIKAFGTEDVYEISKKIVREGEILLTKEYRDKQQDKKFNEIIDFLSRNTINSKTGNPYTPHIIKTALEEAGVNIKNTPIEEQIPEIIGKLSKVIPLKIETRKIKIIIPAIHTGQVYGILSQYKEKENWLNDGSLEVIVNVPSGTVMNFYEKLNSITHGSALTEEVK